MVLPLESSYSNINSNMYFILFRSYSGLHLYKTPLPMTPAVDFELPKSKPVKRPKTAKSIPKGNSRPGRIVTPSRIPLFYVDMDVEEGTVVLPIGLPSAVSEELIALSIKKKFCIEHIWISAITNALSTLAYSEGLVLPEVMTCGWWRDLRTQKSNSFKSPLGKWTGYTTVKMKAYSEPVKPDVFWSEVKTVADKLKRGAKPWSMIHDAPEQLSAIDRHGIDGYNPEQYQAHVALSYIRCEHDQGGSTSMDPIQIEEYMCARSMSDYSFAPLHVSVTDIRTSKVSCTLMYNRKWIKRHFAMTYIKNIQALLEFVVSIMLVIIFRFFSMLTRR